MDSVESIRTKRTALNREVLKLPCKGVVLSYGFCFRDTEYGNGIIFFIDSSVKHSAVKHCFSTYQREVWRKMSRSILKVDSAELDTEYGIILWNRSVVFRL